MEKKGLPRKVVLAELKTRLGNDYTYKSGKIIGSMCTQPHPLAREAFSRYLEKNMGDLGLFPGVAELEKETISMLGAMMSNPNAVGHIVTGGTEANILALWAARKLSKKTSGQVIVPASAHCSFDKAGDLLGLKIIRARLDRDFKVDVDCVKRSINAHTIALVGIAGTTGLGVVDPIPELSDLASKKELYLHVDAAFGGFVLPFLDRTETQFPGYDFRVPGVSSITVDPHKMGLASIPAGGILFRNKMLKDAISWNISYLAGGEAKHATVVGTRSGASVIAVWSLLKFLGQEGYSTVVSRCMGLTRKLVRGIRKIDGIHIMTEPAMNVVGLTSETIEVDQLAQQLRQKGWAIALFPKHIRIVVMPHVKARNINDFLNDLREVTEELKK